MRKLLLIVLVGLALVVGCVSQARFDEMESKYQAQIEQLSKRLDYAKALNDKFNEYCARETWGGWKPPPPTTGKISSIDPKSKLITIDIGKDKDVEVGDQFGVWDPGYEYYITRVELVEVRASSSIAKQVGKYEKGKIEVGNIVTNSPY